MANSYFVSVYAKFYNPKLRDDWLKEHGVDQSIPNGGPVFSYSQNNESAFRDILEDLEDYFDNLADEHADETGYKPNKEMVWLEKIRKALG